MKNRTPIPERIAKEVMFRNEAVCCICQKSNVQIHHIDGNNSNNRFGNLAVLCIEDHNRASSQSSMTRGLSPSLIHQFKSDWESRVARKKKVAQHHIAAIREDPFIRFELKRLIYSLPAFQDKKKTNAIIDQLYSWHVFAGYTRRIFDLLGDLHWFLSDQQVAILLDRLYEFFWQLIGPHEVKMYERDKKNLLLAIHLLGDLGVQIIVIEASTKTFGHLFYPLDRFREIATWYDQANLKRAMKKELARIKRELIASKTYPQRAQLIRRIEKKIRTI